MRFLFYTHSLVSDWNHGNAHFLRGIMRELIARGHEALALEPDNGWSRTNLIAENGKEALERFSADFPELTSVSYGATFDHEAQFHDADVVIVHEWTDPALVARLGAARRQGGRFTLLFHDTHHRAVSEASVDFDPAVRKTMTRFWHSARHCANAICVPVGAATSIPGTKQRMSGFSNLGPDIRRSTDIVWIGNWGDDERSRRD